MTGRDERVMAAFQELGERSTQQRQAIAEKLVALGEAGEAFSAETLLEDLRRSNSSIGRATVFRTIDKLVQRKVLDRIDFADGERCYRLCESEHHHHHLTCRLCRRVVEFELCLPKAKLDAIGHRARFTIEDHEISLFGLCDKCGRKAVAATTVAATTVARAR
jgi:Fur family transcriptional regulator, ferric uptake regulator